MIICVVLFVQNQRYSVQFTWGIEISTSGSIVNPEWLWKEVQDMVDTISAWSTTWEIEKILTTTTYHNNSAWNTDIVIQLDTQNDWVISQISQSLKSMLVVKKFVSDESQITKFGIVWPSIGSYIKSTAQWAIIWWIILMTIYIIFAFMGIRKQISPAILAMIAIFTMMFDVLSPAGIYGLTMMNNSTVQIDVIFIVSILTVVWYSINDTIIIFDRVRENLEKAKWNPNYEQIFEDSLRQTMRRSLWTSLSTLLVVVWMYIFGTWDLGRFAFTMMIGIISWSFSSIFLAAPLAYEIMKYSHKNSK